MFLSRLELNPRNTRVQGELRDPYQMHRTFSKAFGDASEYERARCMFRVDEDRASSSLVALVQSEVAPDWSLVTVGDDYLSAPPVVKQLEPVVRAGQRLRFRLRANPTVKRDGRRVGLYREEEQLDWLANRAEKHGFRLLRAIARGDGKVKARRSPESEMTWAAVQFDGALVVTDPEAFTQAFASGIGSAKAFGFGMLSIAPG